MTATTEKASIWHRLYHGETTFDFIGNAKRWFILSTVVIVAGLLAAALNGLNFGIDFRGGTAWEVPEVKGVSVASARDALRPLGLNDAKIQILGSDTLRVQADPEGGTAEQRATAREKVTAALAKVTGVPADRIGVNEVGPSWGDNITNKARNALVIFLIAITLYITFRFEWKMAVGAIAAVLHDILVTIGIYAIVGFEVTPATVIAFLTILGYSLYDTIVVFDKVEENTRGLAATGRMTYADTVNLSMNQVLMRSLNTSLVAILPILSVLVVGAWILGAATLQEFGLALLIGLLTGAYSSIYIASPILAILKEREPRYAAIRQRLESRGAKAPVLTPSAAYAEVAQNEADEAAGAATGGAAAPRATATGPATARPAPRSGNRPPPRPRKKGKRR